MASNPFADSLITVTQSLALRGETPPVADSAFLPPASPFGGGYDVRRAFGEKRDPKLSAERKTPGC